MHAWTATGAVLRDEIPRSTQKFQEQKMELLAQLRDADERKLQEIRERVEGLKGWFSEVLGWFSGGFCSGCLQPMW